MKHIAISGSSGFVGSALMNFLKNIGFNVTPIKRDELNDLERLTCMMEQAVE